MTVSGRSPFSRCREGGAAVRHLAQGHVATGMVETRIWFGQTPKLVAHRASQFAGTLSDGLGKTMDNRHQSEREYIRYHAATSGEHLVAGIHGLAHGIIGGLTSVITSTVEGVKTEGGVSGFISGLGKGLVGTVTKPVAGALDFASETAQAVRDTATLSGPSHSLLRETKALVTSEEQPGGHGPTDTEAQSGGR
ncbi:hypothetical protein J1605_000811 [Eschrichtius robustus]|uniref:Vacuolar protein sorting-associated protein 13D n=1 Tax=Eschrichtius robustus TaxID=9764 RepID=A0AB34GL33_ESCRO|nr:hypothetical protein J1605_000811 [Eschrichtius robustus]